MDDASAALRLAAAAPGLGVVLRCSPGPARDRWLAALRARVTGPWRRMPPGVEIARLTGGVDLASTLQAGRVVRDAGLLAEVAGGVLVVAMAERIGPAVAATLAGALDAGGAGGGGVGGFGVVLLDEGVGDEQVPAVLRDRCALLIALPYDWSEQAADVGPDDASGGKAFGDEACGDEEAIEALSVAALRLGVWSVRSVVMAMGAYRAAGAPTVGHVALAARLVLALRATQQPEIEQEGEPETDLADAPPPSDEPDDVPNDMPDDVAKGEQERADVPPLEQVVAAAAAAIPPDMLAGLAGAPAVGRGDAGRSGAARAALRGRPAGTRAGDPRRGERLDLIATLRAAAPWQRIRNRTDRIEIRRDDFRVARLQARSETTTIFVVDASGSQALNRLAEAKGAIELLLAESYVRRDRVALLAFRGRTAELVLPPTRSLVRAKRTLSQLPGGGGTPLAAGIDAGLALADSVRRRGGTPTLVFLTDGRANVGLDGLGGRARAEADATAAARQVRGAKLRAVLIDTSPRPHPAARAIAGAMAARYVPLPYAGASAVMVAVR